MIKLDNKYVVTEPIINILKLAKSEIKNNKLKDIIDKRENVLITCPIHSNGQERKPACQVYCGDSDELEYGTAHCFACGYKASFQQLINDIFDQNGTFGEEWLTERFGKLLKYKKIISSKIELKKEIKHKYLDEETLNQFAYYHPYMFERKLTKEVIDKFKIGYDKKSDSIVFPVWDVKNNLVMLTQRKVKTKEFYIDENIEKPVYLLNFILKEKHKLVYVCESQINALTLQSWGYPAVALLGTGSEEQYNILNKSGIRKFILCFDGDNAGDKGIKNFIKNIKEDTLISIKKIPRNKDCNDLTKEEFENLALI